MSQPARVAFLHGLGETEHVWEPVAQRLPGVSARTLSLIDGSAQPWHLNSTSERIAGQLDAPAHLVGLSLGAVVALDVAAKYPEKVASLFLSAPQVHPPAGLMRTQIALLRLLPERLVGGDGVTKAQMLDTLKSLQDLDLRPMLSTITVPVTVACGAKDRPNLRAARTVASSIPHARLEVIPGAGHRWHATHPDAFAEALTQHLQRGAL